MDTVHELSSQAPTEQENWEVYRDAFAPPQDTRRPKPWERSSVPAHAPRLQGQKIWKKAGVKIRNNKENEAALLELQSEGNGARKKRKVWTAKENIADALWQSALSVPEPFIYNQDNTDVNNGDHAATGGRDDAEDNALRFVPRKRTNTDHVITPRKPLRQTHLNSQAQTLSAVPNEALSNISTRRKKSMRRSSIRKSTNMRASARFSSGNGPRQVSDDGSSALPVQQPPETTSQFMFGTNSSTVGNKATEHELENHQPIKTQDATESDEMDIDCQVPSTVKGTKGSKGRKRSSVRRDSKRSSRSSVPLASITEDLPVQLNETTGKAGSGLTLDQDLCHLSDAGVPSRDGSVSRHGRETQNSIQFGVSNEIVLPVAPTENQLERPPAAQPANDLQQVVQAAEPADGISHTGTASTTLGPSPEQLQRTDAREKSQTAEPLTTLDGGPSEAAGGLEMESPEKVADLYYLQDENPPMQDVHVSRLADGSAKVSSSPREVHAVGISEDLEVSIQPRPEDTSTLDSITVAVDEVLQAPPADSSASQPVSSVQDNTSSASYEDDDTDMLRKFLTRVKANKAAKAEHATPQRKRSLPHSPLRLPLGDIDTNASPSPLSLKPKDEFGISAPSSPSPKRRKRNESAPNKEQKTIRRSGRTRLPVKATTSAPSLIPVRRLGQDGDSTVTLRQSEEKELAALTRVNTRKNKGAMGPTEVLLLKAAEKADPVLKQRLLKEMFEEQQKKKGDTSETGKTVAWAKELAQFRFEKEIKVKEKMGPGSAEKPNAVRLGAARNKIALRKTANGTPGPQKRTRDRP